MTGHDPYLLRYTLCMGAPCPTHVLRAVQMLPSLSHTQLVGSRYHTSATPQTPCFSTLRAHKAPPGVLLRSSQYLRAWLQPPSRAAVSQLGPRCTVQRPAAMHMDAGVSPGMPLGQLSAAGDAQFLSPLSVAFAALLIVVQAATSLHFRQGLHWQLLLAAVRCVLQLSVLGYILVPIFKYGSPWPVLAYAVFMVVVSTMEAIGRPQRKYNGMFVQTLAIITGCAAVVMAYATFVILRVHPWWEPQYMIPILGMVLGNTISGISLGLVTTVEELLTGADRIERLLALGATRWEATSDLLVRATKTAMTPLLNQMSVVGLVSIPGMMTGQILAGTDPSQAARYQMIIMFMLSAASTLGAVASIYACIGAVLDSCHRLRPERLLPSVRKGVPGYLAAGITAVVKGSYTGVRRLFSSCCGPRHIQGPTEELSPTATTDSKGKKGQQQRGKHPMGTAPPTSEQQGLREPLLAGRGEHLGSEAEAPAAASVSEPDEEKGDLGSSGSMVEADRASHGSGSGSIVVVSKDE